MRVLVIADDGGVSEFYRAATPYRMLAEAKLIESVTFDRGQNPAIIDHLAEFDAVVFSRADSDLHSLILLHAKYRGLWVVYDVDDNLILIPPSIGAYGAWHVQGAGQITARLWHFKRNLQLADMLTVSTTALGRQLCDGAPHRLRPAGDYLVLPNQIVEAEWSTPVSEADQLKPAGQVWVGWWGIYNHWDDFRDIAPHIEPVIADRPQVRLVLLGMPELAHLFPVLRKLDRLIVAPFVPPAQLPAYRQLVKQFDVALAPTSPCPFNESKSDLKMLQYGAAGVPTLASKTTYGEWRHYASILDQPGAWGGALAYVLDNLDIAEADGVNLRNHVLGNRTYERNFMRWMQALKPLRDDTKIVPFKKADLGNAEEISPFWKDVLSDESQTAAAA